MKKLLAIATCAAVLSTFSGAASATTMDSNARMMKHHMMKHKMHHGMMKKKMMKKGSM